MFARVEDVVSEPATIATLASDAICSNGGVSDSCPLSFDFAKGCYLTKIKRWIETLLDSGRGL